MVKGVYILAIEVNKSIGVVVGALGSVIFEEGLYVYVGSGQNSIEKRVERHCRKSKRLFWHIDYLLSNSAASVSKIFYKNAARAEECEIARKLCGKSVPIRGFGSSDCNCLSHLFKVKSYQVLEDFIREVTFEILGRSAYG